MPFFTKPDPPTISTHDERSRHHRRLPLALPRRTSMPPAGAPASARLLYALLSRMAGGELSLTDPAGGTHLFGPGADHGGRSDLKLHDWRVARDVLTGGDVAFAEAYMDGRWDTSDLTAC